MRKLIGLLLTVFVLSLFLSFFPTKSQADTTGPKIIITEVKLGGGSSIPKEFVTLYNQSSQTIILDNFTLEYIKDDFDGNCNAASWGGTAATIRHLDGVLASGEAGTFRYNLTNENTLTDSKSGSIRLVEAIDETITIQDRVGWGEVSVCYETLPAPFPPGGGSIQRYINCDTNVPIDADNNSADFAINNVPGPGSLAGPLSDGCQTEEPPVEEEPPEEEESQPLNSCQGIIISELLPNPAGSDSGREFIELHNPTNKPISLESCRLSTSANTKVFIFEQFSLTPGQYIALYDTGLTLENSAGGSVFLIDTDNTELNQVDYPLNLDDDVAWILADNNWAATFLPTPNEPNVLVADKPCPVGETRNPDSGRCISLAVEAAGLTVCKAGQERNPQTNRCRNVTSLATVLKACDVGQTRNPETNRCRKAEASSLTPCKEGQERNPETNRCRNVSSLSSDDVTDVKDVLAASTADKSSWFLAVGSMAAAFGYAIWEWRNEILQQLFGIRQKLPI